MRVTLKILVFCLCSVNYSMTHDLVVGRALPSDILLYKVNEWKRGFPLMVRSSTIKYPETKANNYVYISAIYVQDHYYYGHEGYPSIKSGGVGQSSVSIKLKTQRSHGMNFTIFIHGRYLNGMY
nr:venom polypeptide precursor [Doratifera vulnerans]